MMDVVVNRYECSENALGNPPGSLTRFIHDEIDYQKEHTWIYSFSGDCLTNPGYTVQNYLKYWSCLAHGYDDLQTVSDAQMLRCSEIHMDG